MVNAMAPRLTATGVPAARPVAVVTAAALAATLAAVSPGWQGALSIAWLALVAMSWRSPVTGLTLVALAVPLEQRLTVPTLAGAMTAMEFTVWALAAGSLPRLVRHRRVALDRVAAMHLAVVCALVVSIAAGDVRVLTWWTVVQAWLLALLVYVVARGALAGGRSRRRIVSALAAGVVVNAGVAVWQQATGAGPESFEVGGAVRVFGLFQHPNTLASYLALVLPMLLAVSLARRMPATWLWRAAAGAGVVTLAMTQSRGGLLALAAAGVALLALAPRRVQRWGVAVAVAVSLLIAAAGAGDRVPGLERFGAVAPAGGATQVAPATWGQLEREAHWGAARSMLTSRPLLGVGAGEFNDAYREHTPEWRFRVGRGHAHNAYLQLGAEAGLPGLLAYAGWVGTILVALWRRVLATAGIDYVVATGALGAALAWAINGVFEYQDVPSIPVMFALVVAIGLGGTSTRSRGDAIGDAP